MSDVFYAGDWVTWTSSSGGHSKTKVGVIVAVVLDNESPGDCVSCGLVPADYTLPRGHGLPRNHRSYLVKVGNSKRLYWPLVKNLKLATEGERNG